MRSLRSTLILSSFLWTGGLLALMHMLSLAFFHVLPYVPKGRSGIGTLIGILSMVAGVAGVLQGLASFRHLKTRLGSLRLGEGRRVEGEYPSEVQPLIDELNALLDQREKAVQRAMATAGDLAHGLKTPLALLAQEAERAEAAGNSELAESISQQVERMSRQVTYHLARARAAASGVNGASRSLLAGCVDGVTRTVMKLYSARALQTSVHISPDISVRVQQEDLEEVLGNLLENACQWSRSRITVEAVRSEFNVILTIDDDGPGLDPAHRARVLERGVRVDESAPGSGLGLAIVRDLAELYGGSVSLEESPWGGLKARVLLPSG